MTEYRNRDDRNRDDRNRDDRNRDDRNRDDGEDRPRRGSRRRCEVCNSKPLVIDYKNVDLLKRFLNEHGQIESARKIGCGAKCQRAITIAIKRARHMSLLPYTSEHIRISGVSVGRPMPQRR